MSFSNLDMTKALAIVNIFETGQPFGEYGSLAVHDDAAGISFGIVQFTHRSGSLLAVVERYLSAGGAVGKGVIESRLPILNQRTNSAIRRLAADAVFKKALAAAAVTNEMRLAQHAAANEIYLGPSIDACSNAGFVEPLSLAVVYDSHIHGSWERISGRVPAGLPERQWIASYVFERGEWLRSIPRLRKTAYRTDFFTSRIRSGDWRLGLPVKVNSFLLSARHIQDSSADAAFQNSTAPTALQPTERLQDRGTETVAVPPETYPPKNQRTKSGIGLIEEKIDHAAAEFDRVESMVDKVIDRKDAAKSLWTTVGGTVWQTLWAAATFAADMPREVWFVVAVLVGVLMLAYLYRQISLGKLREKKEQI